MNRVHSEFAPSSLKRKLACPGSHRLEQSVPAGEASKSSVYAAEGTAAHQVAEAILQGQEIEIGSTIRADGWDIVVTDAMVEDVGPYVQHVEKLRLGGYQTTLEARVSLNGLWKIPPADVFGHLDCQAYHPKIRTLEVVDLKFGRGVPVSAQDNPQLLAYAAGARQALGQPVDTVRITIVQPRVAGPSVRSDTYAAIDLDIWIEEVFKTGVARCFEPDAPLVPGEHCRFCPARAACPELHKRAVDTAREDFALVGTLTEQEISDRLELAEILEGYFGAIRQLAASRLGEGKDVPGWGLVPKRAIRKWVDEQQATEAVLAVLSRDVAMTAPVLKSPAQIEKLLPKTDKGLLKALVEAVSSGTTLTRTGKSTRVSGAERDFA